LFSGSLYFSVVGFDAYFKNPTLQMVATGLKQNNQDGEMEKYQVERAMEMSAFLLQQTNAARYRKTETMTRGVIHQTQANF
jgi:hypothetical protein